MTAWASLSSASPSHGRTLSQNWSLAPKRLGSAERVYTEPDDAIVILSPHEPGSPPKLHWIHWGADHLIVPACVLSHFSRVWLFVTLRTGAWQAPLSRLFSRLEYWSGLPCPPPGDLPQPVIKPSSPVFCIAGRFFTAEPSEKPDHLMPLLIRINSLKVAMTMKTGRQNSILPVLSPIRAQKKFYQLFLCNASSPVKPLEFSQEAIWAQQTLRAWQAMDWSFWLPPAFHHDGDHLTVPLSQMPLNPSWQ